jgi:predicted nucleic acid-binding protein
MLVLDANILIRAVLGSTVLLLLRKYAGQCEFFAPDVAFREARENLPETLGARKIADAPAMETLELLTRLVQTVEAETYSPYQAVARARMGDGARPTRRQRPDCQALRGTLH